ncbi:MAG: aldo/keto reductase [Bacteroidales bacterium]|nr:aldo/keto reductase [Bacteroidales bacterium]
MRTQRTAIAKAKPELLATLRDYNAQAKTQGLKLSQYALRWVIDQPAVTSVLVGASSVSQLATNLAAVAS